MKSIMFCHENIHKVDDGWQKPKHRISNVTMSGVRGKKVAMTKCQYILIISSNKLIEAFFRNFLFFRIFLEEIYFFKY